MSSLHKQAMEAVLKAAEMDVLGTLEEQGIKDRYSEEGDQAAMDVAILHGYRVFMRICEANGVQADADLFAEMAAELADDIANDRSGGDDQ
ncbi:hypothetical protein GE253_05570 [Niveispirillum sp. SYP-B3756]|jgi:hypothetical protein|uniref:hypothetical protein n=1 Tax=Azospirillaceae TaxID=2829815 RepID=UPI000B6419B0|nr:MULTISPECIES: hypothetical protein [Azospirillaceae]MDG5496436.1 hypothetical protein [Niveispirillum sp. BGYR6]MQP64812.1 hypothetical protein [Niveispirillum sp. SYP-B3756]SNS96131.1 hypothetical protein SAMN05880556_11681 [Azospirillum sp. RU38E]SNT12626.1 hypothetical protein SAMN05880591_11681 [Azospirillum sp. RU37A]